MKRVQNNLNTHLAQQFLLDKTQETERLSVESDPNNAHFKNEKKHNEIVCIDNGGNSSESRGDGDYGEDESLSNRV